MAGNRLIADRIRHQIPSGEEERFGFEDGKVYLATGDGRRTFGRLGRPLQVEAVNLASLLMDNGPVALSNSPGYSSSNGECDPSFTRRRASSRSSRFRRNGVSLAQAPISAAVLPQPRHHPVLGSRRQTSTHGDCARFALRVMEAPRS